MRRRMLMAQVIERELEEEEVARSICISRFVNFLSSLKHDFPKRKFSLLWYVEDSHSPLFYFCIPVQFQPSIWISAVASLAPPLAHSEILTVNWPGTPTFPCPTSYSRRKKATMMKMISMMMVADINWAKKKRFMTFFSEPRLTTHFMIMIMLMVIIIITFAKPLMTGTYNDYLRHVASGHQTHFRS